MYAALTTLSAPSVNPTAPPGADKLLEVLNWVGWLAAGACVIGLIIVGINMALRHRRGEAAEHGSGLAWVMAGCVVVGSASALVSAFGI